MEDYVTKAKKSIRERITSVRIRTLTLTIAIVIALIFYFLVVATTKTSISLIDFIVLTTTTIIMHFIYFPDGKLFGEKDKTFIANRDSYNKKANAINSEHKVGKLREFCKYDFIKRKNRYLENELGAIGITINEFEYFRSKDEKYIKSLKSIELDGRMIYFSKSKRKRLYALLFHKLPVEENTAETIMSAVENNGYNAIKNNSTRFDLVANITKILTAILVGAVFCYVGYKLRNGIDLTTIVTITMFATALFSTAVTSYTSGETSTKVFKSRFYLELSNFLDEFDDYCLTNKE